MSRIRALLLIFLCILVSVTVLAVLAANTGLLGQTNVVLNFAKFGMAGVVAEIIALFIFVTKALFRQPVYSIVIGPPNEIPGFDITRISSDNKKCFINY